MKFGINKSIVSFQISRKINTSLKENFPDGNVEFIAEPGCYYVGSAVTLATAIIGKRNNSEKGITIV